MGCEGFLAYSAPSGFRRRPAPGLWGLHTASPSVKLGDAMLYRFDGVDEQLDLVPMAARRAFDLAGRHVSLEGWRSLPLALRKNLVQAGAAPAVDVDRVREAAAAAVPAGDPMEATADPSHTAVPEDVARVFGRERPVPDSVWSTLSPLDRYTLAKVCRRGRRDRIDAAYEEIIGRSSVSSHLSPSGEARMIDVGSKAPSERRAVGESRVRMSIGAFERLRDGDGPKGDVLGTARIAGIMAAKRTADLIPLCHPIALTKVSVEFDLDTAESTVRIVATVEARDRTGVEMEALTAASVGALTIYDMLKSVDRGMTIGPTELVSKSGGRSGDYQR